MALSREKFGRCGKIATEALKTQRKKCRRARLPEWGDEAAPLIQLIPNASNSKIF